LATLAFPSPPSQCRGSLSARPPTPLATRFAVRLDTTTAFGPHDQALRPEWVQPRARYDRESLCLVGVLPRPGERDPLSRSALPDPHRSYGLMRQTSSLWNPLLMLEIPVFAGCCEPLLEGDPSRRYLRNSFPRCLDPYPGASPGAITRFFPGDIGLRRESTGSATRNHPYGDFWTGMISRLQSFDHLQASRFACHPDRSYRRVSTRLGAAVAFTSEHLTGCYLPVPRIC